APATGVRCCVWLIPLSAPSWFSRCNREASMHRSMLLALVMLAAAGAAGAQGARLTAAEARAELFGVELAGVHEGAGDAWRECIEPSGRTLYTRFGQVREGRLEIRADG